MGSPELVHAPDPLDPSTLPESEPAVLVHACVSHRAPLPPPHYEPLPRAFWWRHRALQTLVQAAGCLAPPPSRGAFLAALVEAVLPPRVISALDDPPLAQAPLRAHAAFTRLARSRRWGHG